uniref:Uncharacterized protein n=1 Tax=Aegilops tauschii TaxID=37682 RepID=R7WFC0_AEGTA
MAAAIGGFEALVEGCFECDEECVPGIIFWVNSDFLQSENLRSSIGQRQRLCIVSFLEFLPDWGVGYKVAKTTWRDVSYQITKINLYKDGRHGKAWGIRHKAGVQVADAPIKLSGVNKRGWKYIKASQKTVQDIPAAETPAAATATATATA